ncbi:MAG: gamma-glutamylcyclotransferase [Phycisphaerae bacterium]|nr:gamma-glutamylcyclotransferase [Phycisphaerae bacterium]
MSLPMGAFPALVPGDGIVRGVVLDINPDGLLITDQVEGHRPDARACFYQRQKVEIRLDDGGTLRGWTYFYGRPVSVSDSRRLVVGEQDGVPIYAWR